MFSYLYGLIVAFLLISGTVVAAMLTRGLADAMARRRTQRATRAHRR